MNDWKLTLVNNYKNMDLNEHELSMIFVVDALLEQGETFITPDMLSLKMTLSFEEIDNYFTGLLKRCYFSMDKDLTLSIENIVLLYFPLLSSTSAICSRFLGFLPKNPSTTKFCLILPLINALYSLFKVLSLSCSLKTL